jgi:dTDP-4-dehydrorhamnose reductase
MMEILLLGKNGQVGWELQRTLACLGTVTALDYPEVDFTQPDTLVPLVRAAKPDVIVNAAAHTAVDRAESEPEIARLINTDSPGVLAAAAEAIGAAFVHFSTDYVFDGTAAEPYVETDSTHPINVYGETKLAGEEAVQAAGGAWLIFRTAWVYSLRQGGFVNKVLSWATENKILKIVTDQVAGPTSSRMLAEMTAQVLAKAGLTPRDWIGDRRGIYHLAGDGYASRFDWARAILACDPHPEHRQVEQILPAESEDFPTPARRPSFSALNCDKMARVFGLRMPEWREGLRLMMESMEG